MATNQTTSCDAAGFLVFSDLCTSYSAGGLLTAVVHVPEIAIKAIASVPLLTAQLNSVAWIISTALVLFITPILIFTLLCYAWSLKSVGPARKTLSTIFILLLWPVVPMLGVIAVTLLWSVLALVVMAFIVVLPLAGTVYVIWLFCAVLSSWKDDLERSHSDYADITFFELERGCSSQASLRARPRPSSGAWRSSSHRSSSSPSLLTLVTRVRKAYANALKSASRGRFTSSQWSRCLTSPSSLS